MDQTSNAQPIEAAIHPFRWAMLAGVWLLYLCFGLTATSLAPLVAPVSAELGLSHAAMGSVLGAWPLVYIAAAMPCGALLDRLGTRWSLFLAALVIALSAMLRGLAVGHVSLFLAVGLFGIGGPLISVGAPKLIAQWFIGRERGFAMGIYITGPAIGGIAAMSLTNSLLMPLVGGEWRAVLLLYGAFVVAAGLLWLLIAGQPAARAVERRMAAEQRPPQREVLAMLLRVPAVRVVLLMSVFIFFFNHGLNNWLPEILRSGGMDAVAAGYWASVPTAVGIAGSLLIPRLAVPERRLLILLLLFLCAGGATMLLHSQVEPVLATGLVLQGIARSSLMTIAMLVLVETPEVGPKNAGTAGGLFFSAAEIGGVLGPLTIGLLSDLTGGFAASLDLLTGVCAILLLLLWRLRGLGRAEPAAG